MPETKKTHKKRPSRAKPKPHKDVTSIYQGDIPPRRRLQTKFLPLTKADDPSTD